jgi:hypothetical protein
MATATSSVGTRVVTTLEAELDFSRALPWDCWNLLALIKSHEGRRRVTTDLTRHENVQSPGSDVHVVWAA